MQKVIFYIIIVFGLVISGCVSKAENKPSDQTSSTPVVTPASTQVTQSIDQNKIKEMENKINSMQNQIDELQTRVNRVDLLTPSKNKLIPQVPFKIKVTFSQMQSPEVWIFKENNEVTVVSGSSNSEIASYKLYPNNNTIQIYSKKYDFYGLVLYDDYVTAVYENGWIAWVKKYDIIPPKFNPETQKYELR